MNPQTALRRYPLFRLFESAWLDAWVASGRTLALDLGTTLLEAGTPGAHVFVLQEGRVRVLRDTPEQREVPLGNYGPGDVFGEYALVPPGLNTATCRAASRGRVLRLPLTPLRHALAAELELWSQVKQWTRLHALLGYLREGAFLGFLSGPSVLPLLDACVSVRVPAGHTLQAEGLAEDSWFVVRGGQVLYQPEGGGAEMVLGTGDCFGEEALRERQPRGLAQALTEVECLSLSRQAFLHARPGISELTAQTFQQKRPAKAASFPWVGQREPTDCGLAALAMVARQHGQDVPLEALRERLCPDHRGLSLLQLQQAAEEFGFRCRAVRVTLEQLRTVAFPAIAHQLDGHYVVLYAWDNGRFIVGDPAAGIHTVEAAGFLRTWSNTLLLVVPPRCPG